MNSLLKSCLFLSVVFLTPNLSILADFVGPPASPPKSPPMVSHPPAGFFVYDSAHQNQYLKKMDYYDDLLEGYNECVEEHDDYCQGEAAIAGLAKYKATDGDGGVAQTEVSDTYHDCIKEQCGEKPKKPTLN